MNTKRISEIAAQFDISALFARALVTTTSAGTTHAAIAKMVSERPRPFVKWVGGKRQLLRQFRERGLYPPNAFNPMTHTYYEPFVGGGAVFFDLLPVRAELSDTNKELITTYSVIKNDVDALVSQLKTHIYQKEHYHTVRAQDPQQLSDVERAARFIYLNRTGFNGLYRVNKQGVFNVPFGRYNNPLICDEKNLRRVSAALQHITLAHRDYRTAVARAKKGDFIYFDPPYFPVSKTASFTSYTADSFLEKEQKELRDTFVELHKRGCFVMLSNSDTPFINTLYANIPRVTINKIVASRMINSKALGRGKIKEVLITNY